MIDTSYHDKIGTIAVIIYVSERRSKFLISFGLIPLGLSRFLFSACALDALCPVRLRRGSLLEFKSRGKDLDKAGKQNRN